MGCTASKTTEDKAVMPDKTVANGSSLNREQTERSRDKQKKGSVRARRLSYIMEDDDKETLRESLDDDKPNDTSQEGDLLKLNSPVRVRKLSYLLHSDHLKDGVPPYAIASATMTGIEPDYKKVNQDRFISVHDLTEDGWALFGVFDGHGARGQDCSEFVRLQLPGLLKSLLSQHTPQQAVDIALQQIHEDLKESGFDCRYSGTTAVVCLLKGDNLITAWTGDSRAVLAYEGQQGEMVARPLSMDHKPDLPDEKKRIIKAGGRVQSMQDDGEEVGPARVWQKDRWSPGLAMSRSIGDTVAHSVGVISVPEVKTITVKPGDRFFIVASDGIWEFITNLEASQIVDESDSFQEGCNRLLMEAHQRWVKFEQGSSDDVTLLVVQLRPFEESTGI